MRLGYEWYATGTKQQVECCVARIGGHEVEVQKMKHFSLALMCACMVALVGCDVPAQAAGDATEEPVEIELEQPEDERQDRDELASLGLREVEMMGFEICEPIHSTMFRDEHVVSWEDSHGCVMTVAALDAPESEDLSSETLRAIFCKRVAKGVVKSAGDTIGDAYDGDDAHYDFTYSDDDGELQDGEIKVITDGKRVYSGKIEYTSGHDGRMELFDLDTFRVAGEPVD